MNETKHIFALYVKNLSPSSHQMVRVHQVLEFSNKEFVHRLHGVLRLAQGEHVQIFDDQNNILGTIKDISKKHVSILVETISPNPCYQPTLTVYLPVLKKDDLKKALYGLSAIGVHTIQLFVSEKVHHAWFRSSHIDKLQRILIAAAEQSKSFSLPRLLPPISFENVVETLHKSSHDKVYFDAQGEPFFSIVSSLHAKQSKSVSILVGPEGDFTPFEKESIAQTQCIVTRLTPTILRAEQAVTLAAGALRSLLNS